MGCVWIITDNGSLAATEWRFSIQPSMTRLLLILGWYGIALIRVFRTQDGSLRCSTMIIESALRMMYSEMVRQLYAVDLPPSAMMSRSTMSDGRQALPKGHSQPTSVTFRVTTTKLSPRILRQPEPR